MCCLTVETETPGMRRYRWSARWHVFRFTGIRSEKVHLPVEQANLLCYNEPITQRKIKRKGAGIG